MGIEETYRYRKCLTCKKEFPINSRAPYNNYCPDCTETEAWKS